MAYDELIKNFDRIREYMREFYLYGFKSRNEYTQKSARSYDDARRRVESWLGEYMAFRQTPEGKNVFLSIDSRAARHNPLYAAWKTKSFTDGDITLHFILFDILHDPDTAMTLSALNDEIDAYLSGFKEPKVFDESTVRKKLAEYVEEGLIHREKKGKTVFYRRAANVSLPGADLLDFFSEASPCGVIGSFLLDKLPPHPELFSFKHHYITSAMDSEITCSLLTAMGEKRNVTMRVVVRKSERITERQAVPLRIRISVQNGRQYLLAYLPRLNRIASIRIDSILSVRPEEPCLQYGEHCLLLERMLPHLWGTSMPSSADQALEHRMKPKSSSGSLVLALCSSSDPRIVLSR
ncbi:MAG: WYL domain-containing protein [Clostridia bacterium]|nr:WYL domain-containing protein [Clostridia bacterium]